MKCLSLTVAALSASAAMAFAPVQPSSLATASSTALGMILEKLATKKISKLETLKVDSKNLIIPLKEVRLL
jgi:hypothetical protein